jgi:hypothetical protein
VGRPFELLPRRFSLILKEVGPAARLADAFAFLLRLAFFREMEGVAWQTSIRVTGKQRLSHAPSSPSAITSAAVAADLRPPPLLLLRDGFLVIGGAGSGAGGGGLGDGSRATGVGSRTSGGTEADLVRLFDLLNQRYQNSPIRRTQ